MGWVSTLVNLNHRLLPGTKVQSGFWFARGGHLERDRRAVNCSQILAHWCWDPGHKTAIFVAIKDVTGESLTSPVKRDCL